MRALLRRVAIPCLAAVAVAAAGCAPSSAVREHSLLFITVDTLRGDRLGCTGRAEAATPVLDRLAREGVLFRSLIVSAPITLPSHCTLMTGLLPFESGVRDNRPDALPPQATTLAERLSQKGYATLAVVSGEPLAPGCGLEQGFDRYLFSPGPRRSPGSLLESPANHTTDLALDALKRLDKRKPFFAWIHYFDPHHPYEPPERFRSLADPYDGEVAFVDEQIGRLLKGMEERGLLENALTAVASDHGEGLGDHGEPTHAFFLYDTTIEVPLLLKGPMIPGGRRPDLPVRAQDVADTLWRLLGVDGGDPEGLAGARTPAGRLAAFLKGEGPAPEEETAFSETLYCHRSFRWAELTALRTSRRKLMRGARDEGFDLKADPGEKDPVPEGGSGPSDAFEDLRAAMDKVKETARRRLPQGPRLAFDLPGYFGGAPDGDRPFLEEEKNRALPHPPDRTGVVQDLVRAVALCDGGNLNGARALLEDLAARDPGNPTVYYWMGRAEHELAVKEGNPTLLRKAYASFQEVLARDPDHGDAFYMGIWCLIQLGEFGEALKSLEAHPEEGAGAARHWELKGFVYATRGSGGRTNALFDFEKAVQCFEKSLAIDGDNPRLLERLAEFAASENRADLKAECERRLNALQGAAPK